LAGDASPFSLWTEGLGEGARFSVLEKISAEVLNLALSARSKRAITMADDCAKGRQALRQSPGTTDNVAGRYLLVDN
jgi:hypothetical protein